MIESRIAKISAALIYGAVALTPHIVNAQDQSPYQDTWTARAGIEHTQGKNTKAKADLEHKPSGFHAGIIAKNVNENDKTKRKYAPYAGLKKDFSGVTIDLTIGDEFIYKTPKHGKTTYSNQLTPCLKMSENFMLGNMGTLTVEPRFCANIPLAGESPLHYDAEPTATFKPNFKLPRNGQPNVYFGRKEVFGQPDDDAWIAGANISWPITLDTTFGVGISYERPDKPDEYGHSSLDPVIGLRIKKDF